VKATTRRIGFVSCAIALALVGSLGIMTPVFADPDPAKCKANSPNARCHVVVTFGGQSFDVDADIDGQGKGKINNRLLTAQNGKLSAIINAEFDPDPVIIFSVAFTNNTAAPAGFAMAFDEPINLNGLIAATSSVGYTLTDGDANGVILAPTAPNTRVVVANDVQANLNQVNKGVNVGPQVSGGSAPCSAFAGGTSVCGPFTAANTFSGGPFVDMSVIVSFLLTPNDAAGLSGRVTQDAVPEPGTLLLMGTGLVGLVGGWRRYFVRT